MQLELNKTRVSLSFPFVAVVMLMLLICESEIVLVSLFSSLVHEGGHLFFMLLFGESPRCICFGAFGIRIERSGDRFPGCKKEVLIALGGVFGNLLLVITGMLFALYGKSLWAWQLVAVNAFIGLFNMLPVRLLDFGRCLECVLMYRLETEKAEQILNFLSVTTSVLIFIACVLYNILIGVNVSLIAVSIYIIMITTLKE